MGSCIGTDCAGLVDSKADLLLSLLVESTPVSVNEVSEYMERRLGKIICLTVAVSSKHVLQPETTTNMSDDLFQIM